MTRPITLLLCMSWTTAVIAAAVVSLDVAKGFDFKFSSFPGDEKCTRSDTFSSIGMNTNYTFCRGALPTLKITSDDNAGFSFLNSSGAQVPGRRLFYNSGIQMLDPVAHTAVSFSTMFTFGMMTRASNSPHPPRPRPDGLAFIMVTDPSAPIGAPGHYYFRHNKSAHITLGDGQANSIPIESNDQDHSFIVEFDFQKFESGGYEDHDNHTELGVELQTSPVDKVGVNLGHNNVENITVWIDYTAEQNSSLTVRISHNSSFRPLEPFVSFNLNLTAVMKDTMWVGFCEGAIESHTMIHSWSFETEMLSGLSPEQAEDSPNASLWHASNGHDLNKPVIAKIDERKPRSTTLYEDHPEQDRAASRLSHQRKVRGAVFLALLIISLGALGCGCWLWRCRGRKKSKPSTAEPGRFTIIMHRVAADGPHQYKYKELSEATGGFSERRIVGGGGFGNVFRGFLRTEQPGLGKEVAVKRMLHGKVQGEREFIKEVSAISSLRHRNLVQLLGWCGDRKRGEFLLVYEFMPNGSLDKNLFKNNGKESALLSWPQRYKIVRGIAEALYYLHEGGAAKVIHRDVKTSNVMLDSDYNAKLGDFGLARLEQQVDLAESLAGSTQAAGTWGYMAPETARLGTFTEKSDTFAFGTVILEIACGRQALDRNVPGEDSILVDYVWRIVVSGGSILRVADKRLQGHFDDREMELVLQVGLLCSHPDPAERPSMKQVVQILTGKAHPPPISAVKPSPAYRSLSDFDFEKIYQPNTVLEWPGSNSSTSVSVDPMDNFLGSRELETMIMR